MKRRPTYAGEAEVVASQLLQEVVAKNQVHLFIDFDDKDVRLLHNEKGREQLADRVADLVTKLFKALERRL